MVGDQATAFAVEMGLTSESLSTAHSHDMWAKWKENECQPNFRTAVVPDAKQSCGPYKPASAAAASAAATSAAAGAVEGGHRAGRRAASADRGIGHGSHDTIAMVAIDGNGHVAAGTSTNGARNKVPGRVGDSPIAGAGAYGDSEVGGCGATGDGDQMMRLLPTYFAVERMRDGATPTEAAAAAVRRVAKYYPKFWGAIFCVNTRGEHGGAANPGTPFKYTVVSPLTKGQPQIVSVSDLGGAS